MPAACPAHLICISGAENKIKGFKATGLWFLDEAGTSGCTKLPPGVEDVGAGLDAKAAAAFAARFVKEAERRKELGGGGSGSLLARRRVLGEAGQPEQLQGSGSSGAAADPAAEGVAGAGGSRALEGSGDAAAPEKVARCRPLFWREPHAEGNFLFCDKRQLSWVYYPPHSPLSTA